MGTRIPIPVRADTLQDNSEVLMSGNIPWYNFVIGTAFFTSIIWLVGTDLARRVRENRTARARQQHHHHKECEKRRLRDQQLNHGRRVFNSLQRTLIRKGVGSMFVLTKTENGDGSFSIHVLDKAWSFSILLIEYDFVRYPAPYWGHIRFGSPASGLGILFEVYPDELRWDRGLHELVVSKLVEHFTARES